MKTDLYTKGILTVIAFLLVLIIYNQKELIAKQEGTNNNLVSIYYKFDKVREILDDIEDNTY